MRIEEKMLILPALYVINRDEYVTISDLIRELTELFRPSGEDAEILAGRRDTKFSQKVRNLKSHRAQNGMAVFTDIDVDGFYHLTEAGKHFLFDPDNYDMIEYLFNNGFVYEDIADTFQENINARESHRRLISYDERSMTKEGSIYRTTSIKRTRSQLLRATAIDEYRSLDGKIRCYACGFCFEDRYGPRGTDYIEIHPERPICQYEDQGTAELLRDAIHYLKPVCSNCHSMIHRYTPQLSISELQEILRNRI